MSTLVTKLRIFFFKLKFLFIRTNKKFIYFFGMVHYLKFILELFPHMIQVKYVICEMRYEKNTFQEGLANCVEVINKPNVAGAFLHTFVIKYRFILPPFSSQSSKHHNSQAVRARDLKLWENTNHPPCVMCHMSHVMCNVYIQSGGASWWKVFYQRGLPRLVSKLNVIKVLLRKEFKKNYQRIFE